MTVPHERMRALRWGAELLPLIEQDGLVPAELRQRAALLRGSYPEPSQLIELVLENAPTMPLTWAKAIFEAHLLFLQLQSPNVGSEETRNLLRYALRHFAQPHLLRDWTITDPGNSIQTWLLLEP
ncbi:BPSL0761 family protein [Roseateles albus]|uniref:Uncharacterized protein n=1 Tax=Roseateles albus TaxID=2987525 RepID=A0ABT5KIL9_9BURK|nr:BPSL0761 family protein [Roseateles albus]MDC8773344.1 hypothetical protein [Roseateles albus]